MPILSSLLTSFLGVEKPPPDQPNVPPQQSQSSSPAPSRPATISPLDQPREHTPVLSRRSLRQLGLFLGGCSFLSLSILVSRRAVARHILKSRPKYFQPNHHLISHNGLGASKDSVLPENKRDPLVALEALNLATLNVFSFAMMMAGGVSWALDLSSLDDLKTLAQRSLHGQAVNIDEEEEREVSEWIAKTLGMKVSPNEEAGADEENGGKKP